MSKSNALAGLIGCYGDSGDESDDGLKYSGSKVTAVPNFPSGVPPPGMIPSILAKTGMHSQPPPSIHHVYAGHGHGAPMPPNTVQGQETAGPTIHPSPIAHCPWSACYDEGSGFTYYWNQTTNAVTWEAPPEYLLALKLAQQQLSTSGTTEISAAEWNLYQQALVDKQNPAKITMKPAPNKPKKENRELGKEKNGKAHRKRCYSDEENEKIELITSYHNSDSESEPEPEKPKAPEVKPPLLPSKVSKVPHKKARTKPMEYGPALPPTLNYTIPIGPEIPPEVLSEPKVAEVKLENDNKAESTTAKVETEDNQDENLLLQRLKDKAKLLEKLGGELPTGLEKIIKDTDSGNTTPIKTIDDIDPSDIDNLLEEIEKKELPKVTKSKRIDMFDEHSQGSNDSHRSKSSNKSGTSTPSAPNPLFPSSKNIEETPALFPSAAVIEEPVTEKDSKAEAPPIVSEKKGTNLYLSDPSEPVERPRKKLRISNSVLPERKKSEMPSYTTKYSQHIEGFSSERVGLGFSQDGDSTETPKAKIVSYGNGLTFTKGEVLNEKDEELENLTDLVEAKLKHLNELQPGSVTPLQEMLIQMQTLSGAWSAGALSRSHWARWARGAAAALARHEARAAPPGWTCRFQRSAGRYRYTRADGFEQWEYPAVPDTDMDICTTPPHPGIQDEPAPPPLPLSPPPPVQLPPPPPPPPSTPPPPSPPAPAAPRRVVTPPPPAWHDPPPPGCDDLLPLPMPVPKLRESRPMEPKQEIGDELLSFYNDLAELEKESPAPTEPNSPEPPPPATMPTMPSTPEITHKPELFLPKVEINKFEERQSTPKPDKEKPKKKSKLKISTSMGMKQKTVSNMVAKWQQVADEIHSD